MAFHIKHKIGGDILFTCKLPEDIANLSPSQQLGWAVREAMKSNANLHDADLHDADLRFADLRNADLHDADLRFADLRNADLHDADLRGADLRFADLRDTILHNADLTGADLTGASLRGADLPGWIPHIDSIHRAVYTAASKPDALDMSEWHKTDACGTTHCRAGWVIHLAGEAGRALEGVCGTNTAAALIYQASDPALERIPDFYVDNETALADMKRLAEGI